MSQHWATRSDAASCRHGPSLQILYLVFKRAGSLVRIQFVYRRHLWCRERAMGLSKPCAHALDELLGCSDLLRRRGSCVRNPALGRGCTCFRCDDRHAVLHDYIPLFKHSTPSGSCHCTHCGGGGGGSSSGRRAGIARCGGGGSCCILLPQANLVRTEHAEDGRLRRGLTRDLAILVVEQAGWHQRPLGTHLREAWQRIHGAPDPPRQWVRPGAGVRAEKICINSRRSEVSHKRMQTKARV